VETSAAGVASRVPSQAVMSSWLQDVRFAVRMLRKAPGATAVAVLSLALAIAVNTTVFSWVRGVLLNPVPGAHRATELVTIETVAPSGEMIDSSYPDYREFRDRARQLSGVIAFKELPLALGVDESSERVWAMMTSGNYFDVLGVRPALGRFFQGAEQGDEFNAAPVAVLGHQLWMRRFNGDPAIIGRPVMLNRRPFTVIGVAPAEFVGTITGLRFDLYVPLTMQQALTGGSQWLAKRGSRPLYLFARLAPGVSLPRARSEVTTIAAALAKEFPASNQGLSATSLRMADARRGAQSDLGVVLRTLLAVGGLVLLIVTANVTNLQLARATTRFRELGLRLGLGATRARLVRQLMIESITLAVVAGVVGVLLSAWLVEALTLLVPFVEYPIALSTTLGAKDLLFAVAVTVAGAVMIGLWPALRVSATNLADVLKPGGRHGGLDPRTSRMRTFLVVGEVALAMVSLVCAGLLVRSFENTRRVSPGFEPRGVVLCGINLSIGGYDLEGARGYIQRARERVGAIPGVRSVAFAGDVPLGFNGGSWEDLTVDGYVPTASENMKIYRNPVSPGYFDLMRIARIEGRDFTELDTPASPAVAIVNQEFARRYFAGQSPVGRTFRGWGRSWRIVGEVATTKYHQLTESPQPYFYVPLAQTFTPAAGLALHVRTDRDPAAIERAVVAELRRIDPRLPAPITVTLKDYIAGATFTARAAATLLAALAVMAVVLAAVGLYSLIAFGVAVRRQEIGVRMALGAAASDILHLVVRDGILMGGGGVVAGTMLAVGATRALGSLLFGVGPLDPSTLVASAALLGLIALLASSVPAGSAARTDPMVALRE